MPEICRCVQTHHFGAFAGLSEGKDKPFRVFDTHSGVACTILVLRRLKPGRGKAGAGSNDAPPPVANLIGAWKSIVGEGHYPGSPRVAHALLRASDRLSLFELHAEDSDSGWNLKGTTNARL